MEVILKCNTCNSIIKVVKKGEKNDLTPGQIVDFMSKVNVICPNCQNPSDVTVKTDDGFSITMSEDNTEDLAPIIR